MLLLISNKNQLHRSIECFSSSLCTGLQRPHRNVILKHSSIHNLKQLQQQYRRVKIDLSDKTTIDTPKTPTPTVYHPWIRTARIIATISVILLVIYITKSFWLFNASFHAAMVCVVYLKKFLSYISLLLLNLFSGESEVAKKFQQNKPL